VKKLKMHWTFFFKGNYKIDTRAVLQLISTQNFLAILIWAQTNFTIMKKDTSSMITVHVHVDGELLNSYWSDGIIVSTPTGSTRLLTQLRRPLVYPSQKALSLRRSVPQLGTRPIVVSDSSEITFQVERRSKKYLVSLDSRF